MKTIGEMFGFEIGYYDGSPAERTVRRLGARGPYVVVVRRELGVPAPGVHVTLDRIVAPLGVLERDLTLADFASEYGSGSFALEFVSTDPAPIHRTARTLVVPHPAVQGALS